MCVSYERWIRHVVVPRPLLGSILLDARHVVGPLVRVGLVPRWRTLRHDVLTHGPLYVYVLRLPP